MVAVREDLVLHRQERAAGVHQVDAGQVVLQRDFLGAQVLLDRHWEVGAALDGGVIGDDQHVPPVHQTDAGNHPGAGAGAVVHVLGGQRGDLQERRALIEQLVHAFAGQQLSAFHVACAGFLGAAECGPFQAFMQFGHQRCLGCGIALEVFRIQVGRKGFHEVSP